MSDKERFITEYLVQQIKAGKLDLEKNEISAYLVASKEKDTHPKYLNLDCKYKSIDEVSEDFYVSEPEILINKTFSHQEVFDASDVWFIRPLNSFSDHHIFAVVIVEHETKQILYILKNSLGMPTLINGGDILVTWGNDKNKIFKIEEEKQFPL